MLYTALFKISRFFLTAALKVSNRDTEWALCSATAMTILIEGASALDKFYADTSTITTSNPQEIDQTGVAP